MDLSEAPAVLLRRHPWEMARLGFFRRLLRSHGLDRQPIQLLDAGSGDAWFARTLLPSLHPSSSITCWDTAYTAAQIEVLAREAGPRLRLVAEQPTALFDLVLLLDLLEHIENDAEFLRSLVDRNLAPGAHVLVSVPAWSALFGDHDVQLRHFRRYAPDQGARLLEQAGLCILSRGGLFHSLLLPRIAERVAARLGLLKAPPPNAGEWRAGTVTSAVVEGMLTLDGNLSSLLSAMNLELPGLSWWALCTRPSS